MSSGNFSQMESIAQNILMSEPEDLEREPEYSSDEDLFIDQLAEILVKQALYRKCADEELPED